MTKAVDAMCELCSNTRIDAVLIGEDESVLEGRKRRRELIEHDSVVLHLGTETSGLEDALAVPTEVKCLDAGLRR